MKAPFKLRSGNTSSFKNLGSSSSTENKNTKKVKKTKSIEDLVLEGFTLNDARRMQKDGATTGHVDKPAKNQSDFEPAYPGADYSQADIDKMTEEEKIAKIDGYVPKNKKTKKTKR